MMRQFSFLGNVTWLLQLLLVFMEMSWLCSFICTLSVNHSQNFPLSLALLWDCGLTPHLVNLVLATTKLKQCNRNVPKPQEGKSFQKILTSIRWMFFKFMCWKHIHVLLSNLTLKISVLTNFCMFCNSHCVIPHFQKKKVSWNINQELIGSWNVTGGWRDKKLKHLVILSEKVKSLQRLSY